jgi:acyl-CoA synthetase (NDP forming)
LTTSKEESPFYPIDKSRATLVLQKAMGEKGDLLLPEAMEFLQACGISVADYQIVHRKEDLGQAIEKIGFPAAMKVISPEISHKSDVGGVILHIDSRKKAEEAYDRIMSLNPENRTGVLLQKMISAGKEVILGAKRDPSFGPVILFGLGGIYVEVLKETSLRVAPINRSEAEEMISELKSSAILKGVRGERPSDIEAIVEMLLKLSQLMIDFPQIEGIDINPLMALEKGAIAVDARILLTR